MRPLAMVTGGTRRVGRAISLELARAGFDLVVSWRSDESGASRVQREIEALGAACRTIRLDLAQVRDPLAARAQVGLDRLDALVLSAASWDATSWGAIDARAMAEAMQVNAIAPVVLAQAMQPMLACSALAGGGTVVAIGDAHAADIPVRGFAAYLMSKAALAQSVRQMAAEMAPAVRVNGVLPGVVEWPASIEPARREAILARIPLGRVGAPEDVARLVRFLCLEAPFMTGALVPVDGGRSIR